MIARGPGELKSEYEKLGPGDVYVGSVPNGHLQQSVMIDLMEKGVHVLPSCLAQTLSRSKTTQAHMFAQWTHPLTRVVSRRIELLESISHYNSKGVGKVVTKVDHKHCGHGVRLWDNIENLYSILGLEDSSYPFVLQPFMTDFVDVRAIVAGDYIEAYTRENQFNFRCNLAAGGHSRPFQLSEKQIRLCRLLMERGRFPYAHIDLMILKDGTAYLSEIALNGGMKGSAIDQATLGGIKKSLLEKMAERIGLESGDKLTNE